MRYRIKAAILMLLFLSHHAIRAQEAGHEPIHWMTIQEAFKAQKTHPRKIFIDMYTQWCGWCKKMDASTFKDSTFAAILNSHFYAVKMDAETRDTILYKGTPYSYKPEYKVNELAALLLNGQMSYPTTVFMDENQNVLSPVAGFMTSEQMVPILTFFGEDIFKTKTWEEYARDYRK